jgi:hypothetical protein
MLPHLRVPFKRIRETQAEPKRVIEKKVRVALQGGFQFPNLIKS